MKHRKSGLHWKTGPAMAIAVLGYAFILGGAVWADQLAISNPDAPNAPPQLYKNITVVGVENGKIAFQTEGGNQVTKDLARVVDLRLDDEKSLNDATDAYAAGNADAATDAYDRAMRNTNKAWLKLWILPHLIDAANKAGRFDAALSAYITLVGQNPAAAEQHRPAVPKPGSAYLDPAVGKLTAAINAADDKAKPALLGLLLDIHKARNDQAAVQAIAQKLDQTSVGAGDASSGMANAAMSDAKITLARQAIKNAEFDKAIAIINESKAIFVDAPHQADALYVLAQALEGKSAGGDADALKDAAIAYMRVVANFKSAEGTPHVVDALMQTGGIMEKLKQYPEAIAAYQSVVKEFPKSPRADEAGQQMAKLKEAQTKAGQ